MRKNNTQSTATLTYAVFSIALSVFFYAYNSHASTDKLAGTQLAYFIGYHSGGMQNEAYPYVYSRPSRVYYSPRYHYKGTYKTPWTRAGRNCRKTCWLDRWTGRALRCYITC